MKKSKLIILIAVIVVLVAGIIAVVILSDKKDGKTDNVPEVKEAQIDTLRVLFCRYEPVIYSDGEGGAIGFDAELIAYACDKMGISYDLIEADFSEMEEMIENDEADCIWTGYVPTKQSREKFDLSAPYVTMEMDYPSGVIVEDWVVAVKKERDDNLLEKIEDALKKAEEDGTIKKLAEKYELRIAE